MGREGHPGERRGRLLVLGLFLVAVFGVALAWVGSTGGVANRVAPPVETVAPAPVWPVTVGCEPWVPAGAQAQLQALVEADPAHLSWVGAPERAVVCLGRSSLPNAVPAGAWTYAVAAPFGTVVDAVKLDDVLSTWRGAPAGPFGCPLVASPETVQALSVLWGEPAAGAVVTVEATALVTEATRTASWALVPFDELEPRWKALQVDGISLLEKATEEPELADYPLRVPLGLGSAERPDALALLVREPEALSNRREERMTVVAMTGVTALTRTTAQVMLAEGVNYPARDIGEWLASADLTHVSNEVSFTPNCPIPPVQDTMQFCSHDRYLGLLETIGTDVVELTGNHLLDYGPEPLLYSLDLYEERGWGWYGGGRNLADATRPLLVTNGPNRLAFIGRNPAGPPGDWATEDSPGSAPCDYDQLRTEIRDVRAQGYLPIVTLQYEEMYQYMPTPQQVEDFRSLAAAGAVVVQGSQAHQPQTAEVYGGAFIHYGLGNLFFDQMQSLGTRQEFVDRLVFYDGRLLGVDLRTALLEDYARPRPMEAEERAAFLSMIFDLKP